MNTFCGGYGEAREKGRIRAQLLVRNSNVRPEQPLCGGLRLQSPVAADREERAGCRHRKTDVQRWDAGYVVFSFYKVLQNSVSNILILNAVTRYVAPSALGSPCSQA